MADQMPDDLNNTPIPTGLPIKSSPHQYTRKDAVREYREKSETTDDEDEAGVAEKQGNTLAQPAPEHKTEVRPL